MPSPDTEPVHSQVSLFVTTEEGAKPIVRLAMGGLVAYYDGVRADGPISFQHIHLAAAYLLNAAATQSPRGFEGALESIVEEAMRFRTISRPPSSQVE